MTPKTTSTDAKIRRHRAIGNLIVSLRQTQGMTQTDLGLKLGDFQSDGEPIPQTTISRWERGTIDMTMDQAMELEMALGVPMGTFARAGGYVSTTSDEYQNVETILQLDPLLDPELRPEVVAAYKSYVAISRRLKTEESFPTPKRRASTR